MIAMAVSLFPTSFFWRIWDRFGIFPHCCHGCFPHLFWGWRNFQPWQFCFHRSFALARCQGKVVSRAAVVKADPAMILSGRPGPHIEGPRWSQVFGWKEHEKKTLSRCFGVKTPGCCELGATKRVNMNWESMTMQRKDNSKHVWEVVESLLSKRRHYPPLIKGVGKSSVPRISNSNKPSMIRPCYIFSIVFLVSLSPISLIWPYLHIYVYVCDINTVHIHTI